ncbi:ester cyclase [Gilliamella sp. Pas-s95]|uniref:ester cyclase n=1 Tax=Gilliamella sp. Pas-s95 TaxID=2687317 RepID=UPI0013208EA5|nr:ester cyclase [Gilliamella sp. Pas-s95]MWN06345.1 ester cyclase [Gilliamella sp. Pas-s95]
MSIKENKVAIQKFLEFINTGNVELSKEIISENAIFYAPTSPEPLKGPSGYMHVLNIMRSAFPDIQWKLEEVVAEQNIVATRFTLNGTHKGHFFGIEPSGKKIEISAMNFYYFSNGKIIKEYGQPDIFGLLKQIGAIS